MTLTGTQLAAVEAMRSDTPFVWCLEIPIPDEVAPSVLRITSHSEPVEWLTDSAGAPLTWDPYPLRIGQLTESTKGTQETWNAAIGAQNRQVLALVDAYEGLEEQIVRARLVDLGALAEGVGIIDLRGRILSCTATQDALTFELGQVDMRRAKLPTQRVSPLRCRYKYKGERCGYAGAIATCDKGLTTPNGCEVHANENRWGGFRGVPRS